MLEVTFRAMRTTDEHFVLSSWLRSYADSHEARCFFQGDLRPVFFAVYEPLVKAMLARSTVTVACLPENHDVVAGWLCAENDTLHYVLAKPKFRGMAVAKRLLDGMEELPVSYSHITQPAKKRLRFPSNWRYAPEKRFT